jgi:polar amino acid transport system substrate-binding protein
MKKIIALLLCLIMAVCTFTACGDPENGNEYDGKLVVATSPDFPPFENLEGGEIVGIEIDLIKLICEELNYELSFESIAFDSIITGVESGKYDCGVAGISVDPDREKSVLFTTPYCLAAQCIVVTAESDISSKADLAGLKVSVQSGTTAEEFCNANGYQVDSYEANADAKLALTTGKVKAWIVDDLTAAEMCKGDDSVKILSDSMTTEPYAFAFNFADEALVEQFNTVLSELIADGTVAALFEQFDAPYTAPVVE